MNDITPTGPVDSGNVTPNTVEGTTPNTTESPATVAANEAIRKFKVKVDGAEEEVDEDTLLKAYSKIKGADKRFEEGAKARKQAEKFVELMKNDPWAALEQMGLNPDDLSQQRIMRKIEQEMMTPEQRELAEAKARLKAIDEERTARETEEKNKQADALRDQLQSEYITMFKEALDSESLPLTNWTQQRMTQYFLHAAEAGINVTAKQVAEQVKLDYTKAIQDIMGQSTGDALSKLLGDDIVKKIRTHDVERIKQPNFVNKQSVNGKPTNTSKSNKNKMSPDEWRNHIAKKLNQPDI